MILKSKRRVRRNNNNTDSGNFKHLKHETNFQTSLNPSMYFISLGRLILAARNTPGECWYSTGTPVWLGRGRCGHGGVYKVVLFIIRSAARGGGSISKIHQFCLLRDRVLSHD